MAQRQGLVPLRDRVRDIDRIYRIAEREIARTLALLDIGNYKELKAIEIQEEIDRLIQMLNRASIKWTKKAVPEAYEKAYSISKTRLEIMGIIKDYSFREKAHKQAIEEQENITMDVLIKANQSIKVNVATFLYLANQASKGLSQFQAFDMRDEEFIDELLGDALRAGGTRGSAMRTVREFFKARFGDAQFININGRNYEMRAYADLVAKTRLRVTQSEAVKKSCQEYQNDLIQISDHGSEFDDICLFYEGKVFSISGSDTKYPFLDAWPPFHPRCVIPKTRILTNRGLIRIKNIKIGDLVYTHRGRFKPVTNIFKRKFRGQLIWINGLGITDNHKMFTESGLIPAGNLTREDKLLELSPQLLRFSNIPINSNYFPSFRNKNSITFSVFLDTPIMSTPINFKPDISYGKINDVYINNFFLNKIYLIFHEYFSDIFSHFRLIFQKIFTFAYGHFSANYGINRRIIINHPNFIFPICLRSGIGNSTWFKSTSKSSFDPKMIKNMLNSMSISSIQTNDFSNISRSFTRIINIGDYFSKRLFKFRLNSFDFIKKLFPFSASPRTSHGVFCFSRVSTDRTEIHNDSFIAKDFNLDSSIMLPYFGQVFNIEVQDDHSYVAEGFLVKNCQHSAAPTSEIALEVRRRR